MAAPAATSLPLLDQFAASPFLDQDGSPLFARLPVEIRHQIYVEFWRTFGSLCPHIATTAAPRADGRPPTAAPGSRYFVAVPCRLTPDVPSTEEPPDEVAAVRTIRALRRTRSGDDGSIGSSDHGDRRPLLSPLRQWPIDLGPSGWSGHRSCRSSCLRLPETAHYRPFLPLLLTCKRAYIEAIGLLYSSLTFQFADADTANVFLARWPLISSVRLYMCLTPALLDTFREAESVVVGGMVASASPGDSPPPLAPLPLPTLSVDHSSSEVGAPSWRRLCSRIAALPRLRRLYVCANTCDYRAWHQIADEVRLFAGLFGASPPALTATLQSTMPLSRVPPPIVVVLVLPAIPPEPSDSSSDTLASTRSLPPGCYLENGPDGAPPRLPCTVRRVSKPSSVRGNLLADIQLMANRPQRHLSIGSSGLLLRQQPPQWP